MLPGETEAEIQAEIEQCLTEHNIDDVRIARCKLEKDPLSTAPDHAAVTACRSALAEAGLATDPTTVAFGTDAGVFAAAGIPGVVLGPGSIQQAHTAREWIELGQVETMVGVFERILEGSGG